MARVISGAHGGMRSGSRVASSSRSISRSVARREGGPMKQPGAKTVISGVAKTGTAPMQPGAPNELGSPQSA